MSIFNINDTEKTMKDKSVVVDYYEINPSKNSTQVKQAESNKRRMKWH